MKENTKKISRLIYVTIFITISAFTFILPRADRSFFGDFSHDFLKDTVFTVAYFKVCKQKGFSCLPTFINGVGALREVTVYGVTISAETYRSRKYLKFLSGDWRTSNWREEAKALNKWNKTTTNEYYKPSTLVKTGLKTTNTVLNFVLFLLSIPLVWYTRDLSLIITKLIKNGWTKL